MRLVTIVMSPRFSRHFAGRHAHSRSRKRKRTHWIGGFRTVFPVSEPSACRRLPPRKSPPNKEQDGIFQNSPGLFCRECLFLLARVALHPPGQLRTDDEYVTAATLAFKADVCAQPCNLPIKTTAGMGLFKAHGVVESEFGSHDFLSKAPEHVDIITQFKGRRGGRPGEIPAP